MTTRLLFDASSPLYALKMLRVDALRRNHVQWLAVYEALNGIWKEVLLHRALPAEKAAALVDVLIEVVKHMNVLSPAGLEREIHETALALGTTIYGASCVVLARKRNSTLVTEDKKLRDKCRGVVEAKSLRELVAEYGRP